MRDSPYTGCLLEVCICPHIIFHFYSTALSMALVVFQLNMYVLCKHECANYASCIGIPSLYEDFTQGPNPNYQLLTLKLDFLKIGTIYILF